MKTEKEFLNELIEALEKRFECKIEFKDIETDLLSHVINALAIHFYRDYLHQQQELFEKKPKPELWLGEEKAPRPLTREYVLKRIKEIRKEKALE